MKNQKHLRFYIDFVSPFSYLAWVEFHKKLASLENSASSGKPASLENSETNPKGSSKGSSMDNHSAIQVDYIPIFLGAIFKLHGITAPVRIAAKKEYNKRDMQRWAEFYGLKFQYPKDFPFNSLYALKLLLALQLELENKAHIKNFIDHLQTAIWQEGKDVSSWHALEKIVIEMDSKLELSAKSLLKKASSPEVKEKLRKNNEEAVAQGVFGVPSFLIGDELFWGNDRLDFVFRKLSA